MSYSKKDTWRVPVICMICAIMAITASANPAMAQEKTTRIGSEVAVGGLTIAEQHARSLQLHEELKAIIPSGAASERLHIGITQKDLDDLAVEQPSGTAPLRVGVVKSIPDFVGKSVGQPFSHGVIEEEPNGNFVWAMEVRSPGAQAIRIHFKDFSLPDSTEMYLLGANGQAHGPSTFKGRNGTGELWSRSIRSDTAIIVVQYSGDTPNVDKPKISFTITDVAHIRGRPPHSQEKDHDSWPCSDNAACLIDVNCVDTGPAAPAEDAVAKMEWIQGPFVNTCSGGLLADTDTTTQIPYFITANHCLSADNSNLETFFNYTTDSCGGDCPHNILTGDPPTASTVGFVVDATGSAGDFTLGRLSQSPPAGAVFLGWNNSPVASTAGGNLYRISNANFGPQVYSAHEVDPTSPECTGWPRGERIYSKDLDGATMGGSSGSPVLNSVGEVVGQLSGCCGFNCGNECDSINNWTVDGALAFYWDSVSEFLDPQTSGCTSDAECDDGLFCTGTEICVGGSCQSSGDPCLEGESCNESTDSCEEPTGDCGDGVCGAGEDCHNCPEDCRQRTIGNPNSRYCCDGDLSECGDSRCNEDSWVCGGFSCTDDSECDDGLFCTGTEICVGGSCQSSGDPCLEGESCNESTDSCEEPTGDCGGNKAPCLSDSDCCSGTCKSDGTCRGN